MLKLLCTGREMGREKAPKADRAAPLRSMLIDDPDEVVRLGSVTPKNSGEGLQSFLMTSPLVNQRLDSWVTTGQVSPIKHSGTPW